MKPKRRNWKRFWFLVAGAAFFTLSGFCIRIAEDSQVGYTNDTSMWTFAIAAIFAWFALLQLLSALRVK